MQCWCWCLLFFLRNWILFSGNLQLCKNLKYASPSNTIAALHLFEFRELQWILYDFHIFQFLPKLNPMWGLGTTDCVNFSPPVCFFFFENYEISQNKATSRCDLSLFQQFISSNFFLISFVTKNSSNCYFPWISNILTTSAVKWSLFINGF